MQRGVTLAAVLTGLTGILALAASLFLWIPDSLAIEAPAGPHLDPAVWKWGLMAATLATSVSSVAAAYAVARLGSAATGALAEKPEIFGRLLILVGLAEGIAIYGLIVSVLILNRLT
jgi:V/A-type H+-transporting ATPase subunit K